MKRKMTPLEIFYIFHYTVFNNNKYKIMHILWVILTLVIVWPAQLLAQDAFNLESNRAVRTGYQLFGGYVTDLGIDSTGRMYASTLSPNGIFSSTDNATSWSGPVAGTDMGKINALAISDEPDTAYVIGGVHLYKTTDAGRHWTELVGSQGDTAANDFDLAIAYANGVLVVPTDDGSVDVSTDEGATFTNVSIPGTTDFTSLVGNSTGSEFYIIASGEETETRTLYVLDTTTLAVTATDQTGNHVWVAVKPTDDQFIVIAGAEGAFYTTTGVSGSWQTLTSSAVIGEVTFVGERIYLGDTYTDDLGATTTRLLTNVSQHAVDPANAETILLGSGTGVELSTDGGDTWSSTSNGITGVTVNDIAQSNNKKTVWLAAQGGLAHSSNFLSETPTWDYPILPDQASTDVVSVWVNPNDSDHIVAGANTLFVSTDGGESWTTPDALVGLTGNFNGIVADDDILYAGYTDQSRSSGAVYTSSDGGTQWSSVAGLDLPVNALSVLNNGTVLAGVGYEFNRAPERIGLFTYDGTEWLHVSAAEDQVVTTVLVRGETIYAAGIGNPSGKVVRSTDNGDTWENVTLNGLPENGYFQSLAAEPSTDTVYVATGHPAATGYVYKSTNGGDDWSLLYTGLVDEEFNSMLFDGLTTGTTLGIQELQSKANITLTAKKSKLTITLKDAATKEGLGNRTIKLYKKHSKHGDWKLVHSQDAYRTTADGRFTIPIAPQRTTYYQVRWKPATADTATYGETSYRSDRQKVIIH